MGHGGSQDIESREVTWQGSGYGIDQPLPSMDKGQVISIIEVWSGGRWRSAEIANTSIQWATFFVPSRSRRWSSAHFFKAASENGKLSSSWKTEDLEDLVGGEVIGGILHAQYLFTLASAWLIPCLPIQSLEKLSKSESVFSKSFGCCTLFWRAQNHFSDISLLLLEATKKVRQWGSLSAWRRNMARRQSL